MPVLLDSNINDLDSIGALRTTLPIVCTLGFTVLSLAFLAANAFTGKPLVIWHRWTRRLI